MSRRRMVLMGVLVALVVAPVLVNLGGWNVYCYLHAGKRDWIGAAAVGSCHLAVGEHVELDKEAAGLDELPELQIAMKDLVSVGPLELFAEEKAGPLQPFTFRVIRSGANWRRIVLLPNHEYDDYARDPGETEPARIIDLAWGGGGFEGSPASV